MSFLPNESYKYQLSLFNSFNNELIRGHNQNLTLYNYDTDLTLYKNINTKPLDDVNFDQINKDLNKNRNIFENTKSALSGAIEGTVEGGANALGYTIEKTFKGIAHGLGIDINKETILSLLGLFILSMIIYKKI
jgi:hypothetical protein